ncbi:MAG TPA: hypothetical protein VG817_04150 [Gemmatimonadales bacterium]|nr:hypothetical protein [Gemmatimonadales bacterium]
MKHQYFGNVNDYRKYGLLRALSVASGLPIGVCWLLTEGDERSDGEFRQYLSAPDRWRGHDEQLYDHLQRLLDPAVERSVQHAEEWGLLPRAKYYTPVLKDSRPHREAYFGRAWGYLAEHPLIFFDPDNGLEPRNKKPGHKHSSRYLFWSEVEETYRLGHSLVIYQHFPRQERLSFTERLAQEAIRRLDAPLVDTYTTPQVLFLVIGRPEHHRAIAKGRTLIQRNWRGQIFPHSHVMG